MTIVTVSARVRAPGKDLVWVRVGVKVKVGRIEEGHHASGLDMWLSVQHVKASVSINGH